MEKLENSGTCDSIARILGCKGLKNKKTSESVAKRLDKTSNCRRKRAKNLLEVNR